MSSDLTPAPGPLNSYSPAKILTCTAISTIENVRFRGLFFFWIDGKRSVFIVNFLDHTSRLDGNRRRKHDVLMGLYIQLVSCFRTPSKYYCNCGRLPFHAPSHAFFLHMIEEIYDRNASLSIYQKKKFIYLYVWSAIVPYTVSCST